MNARKLDGSSPSGFEVIRNFLVAWTWKYIRSEFSDFRENDSSDDKADDLSIVDLIRKANNGPYLVVDLPVSVKDNLQIKMLYGKNMQNYDNVCEIFRKIIDAVEIKKKCILYWKFCTKFIDKTTT